MECNDIKCKHNVSDDVNSKNINLLFQVHGEDDGLSPHNSECCAYSVDHLLYIIENV